MANDDLRWDGERKRWRKSLNGKWHALSPSGTLKTDRKAYDAALQRWYEIKAGAATAIEAAETELQNVKAYALKMAEGLTKLGRADLKTIPANALELAENGLVDDWLEHQNRFDLSDPNSSLKAACETWLKLKELTLAEASYNNLVARLTWLRAILGDNFPLKALDRPTVTKIKTEVMAKGKIPKGGSAFDTFRTIVSFLKWAGEEGYMESLPANLNMKMIPAPVADDADPMPLDQWQYLYSVAPDRTKLYMLFAANCGFTQNDIAHLTPDQLEGDKLTNKRKKTRGHASTPKIVHKLWPETLALIERFRVVGSEWLIPNADGGCLITTGKGRSKVDNVNVAWFRLKAKSKLPELYPFGSIKKRSASLLHASTEFGAKEDYEKQERMILGRGIQGVDARYIEKHYAKFQRGQDWLRTIYLPQR